MKDKDPLEGPSPKVIGKEILIVVAVVCSSLSFTLGYFVGRQSFDRKTDVSVSAPESTPVVQQKPAPSLPADSAPQASGATKDSAQERPVPPVPSIPGPAEQTAAKAAVAVPPQTAPAQETSQKGSLQQTASQNQADEAFVVQLAALRNAGEAKRMKEKYTKKGYKVYIKVTKGKKNEKIYKVRIGEFSERKDAEILALKLKKNDGLNTFVTTKPE